METRVLVSADVEAVEAFLQPRIGSSMFLLGNMHAAGLIDRGERFCGTYAGAFEDGARLGVLFTGVDNGAAQRAYTALGFRHTGAFRLLLLREPWTCAGRL